MLDPRRATCSLQLRSLRVYCDVVRLRSFSAAAAEHGLSQGAVSQTIQNLEEMLCVRLLDRSTRPFVPTAEGQKFFDGSLEILDQFDGLIDEVRGKTEQVSGYVVVGSIYSIGLSYLPRIEEAFAQRYPAASIKRVLAHPDEIYRAVEEGTVDIGLVSYPQNNKWVVATAWLDEPMVLVASPRHRLANAEKVTPASLSSVGLVAFAADLPIRHAIDRALRSVDVSMRTVVELDNIDSVKHAVVVNSGLGFLPEMTVRSEIASGTLKVLQCDGLSIHRPIGFLHRRDKPLTRAAKQLIELSMGLIRSPSDLADVDRPGPDSPGSRRTKAEAAAPVGSHA